MSILVENLSYVYMKDSPFERTALKNINLKIEPGEFVGIIGHTGSGKSTLIQHFNGLLKPTSGRAVVNGIDVSGKNLKELRRQIGLVFQYPEHQLFEETVYKDIGFGIQKSSLDEKEQDQRIRRAAEAVGLGEDILEKSPFELSGGQKRRVAIAGVIVMNPKILVLDEPTAGLDPKGRDEIFGLINDFRKSMGITVILVSHSMEDIANYIERVIVMNDGTIEMDGSPSQVFRNTGRIEEIGLSAPQITYLMKSLKKIKPEINDNIFTLKEAKAEIIKYLRRK